MVQVNLPKREVNCKLVYYGAANAGKSTSIHAVASRSPDGGEVTSLSCEADPDLEFDYLLVELGQIDGLRIKLHVYTVPPQAGATESRQAIMRDADGVIFVTDSRPQGAEDACRCLEQLHCDLRTQGVDPKQIPVVFQWNKRDLPDALHLQELRALLDPADRHQGFPSVATAGEGVVPTLKRIACQVLEQISRDYGLGARSETRKVARPKSLARTRAVRRPARRLTESARFSALSQDTLASGPKVVGHRPRRGLRRLLFGR